MRINVRRNKILQIVVNNCETGIIFQRFEKLLYAEYAFQTFLILRL
jgi:hypothetical protein